MRKILLYISLFIPLTHALSAQDWQLIYPSDIAHFGQSGEAYISHTVRIDSTVVTASGTSIDYLNWVATDCDTCSTHAKLRNQGQFLQKTMETKPNGEVVLRGKNTFSIYPAAFIGSTWAFDGTRTATVSGVELGMALDEPDSIKTILLSDGGVIKTSQNHGLLQWPDLAQNDGYFDLRGIENRALGVAPAQWRHFFDFQIGDVFQRTSRADAYGDPSFREDEEKIRILGKSLVADTLIYQVDRHSKSTLYWNSPTHITTNGHDTAFIRFHPSTIMPWAAYYTGQLYQPYANENTFARVGQTIHPDFGLCKSIGDMDTNGGYCNFFKPIEGQPDLMECDYCHEYWELFAPGLGQVSYRSFCFEGGERSDLVGYIKNGDTTGTIKPDDFFTVSAQALIDLPGLRVFPNPTASSWGLYFEKMPQTPLVGTICNSMGIEVQHFEIASGNTLNGMGEGLPAGLYYLRLQGKDGVSVRVLEKF